MCLDLYFLIKGTSVSVRAAIDKRAGINRIIRLFTLMSVMRSLEARMDFYFLFYLFFLPPADCSSLLSCSPPAQETCGIKKKAHGREEDDESGEGWGGG